MSSSASRSPASLSSISRRAKASLGCITVPFDSRARRLSRRRGAETRATDAKEERSGPGACPLRRAVTAAVASPTSPGARTKHIIRSAMSSPKPALREGRVVAAERTIPRLKTNCASVALHWRYESPWLRRPTVRSRTDRMGCSRPAWSTGSYQLWGVRTSGELDRTHRSYPGNRRKRLLAHAPVERPSTHRSQHIERLPGLVRTTVGTPGLPQGPAPNWRHIARSVAGPDE